jgi:hypothetical protein
MAEGDHRDAKALKARIEAKREELEGVKRGVSASVWPMSGP